LLRDLAISYSNVGEAQEQVKQQLTEDRAVSTSLRAAVDVLTLLVMPGSRHAVP